MEQDMVTNITPTGAEPKVSDDDSRETKRLSLACKIQHSTLYIRPFIPAA